MANRLLRQTAVLLLLADLFNWLTFSQIARQHPRIKKRIKKNREEKTGSERAIHLDSLFGLAFSCVFLARTKPF